MHEFRCADCDAVRYLSETRVAGARARRMCFECGTMTSFERTDEATAP